MHVRVPSWQHLLQLLQALADLLPGRKAGTLLDPGAKPPGYPDSQVEAEPDRGVGERVNPVFTRGRYLCKDVEDRAVVFPVFPQPGECTSAPPPRSISTHFIHFFLNKYSLVKPQQLTCTWLTFLTHLLTSVYKHHQTATKTSLSDRPGNSSLCGRCIFSSWSN